MALPKISFLKFDLRIKILQRKTSRGSQIMVGFMVKTKAEKAKSRLMFLFPDIISFKIIKEKIITGRSGLGDCAKSNKTGRKHR
ncbi:uncharacterized protein CHSO_4226 [Chryseobacterium sp. StRB126]|nr:uncharacterized protein CHSO_4226 [Chryseobacterium sp. StRB126]